MRPSYTEGTSRTYRDQVSDVRIFEQAREQKLNCARNAAVQQVQLKSSLDVMRTDQGQALSESFERDTSLIELVRRGSKRAATQQYEAFATEMEALGKHIAVYRDKYHQYIARDPQRAGYLLRAADALIGVVEIWRSELNAGRDAAMFRAQVEAGMQRDATASARASLSENRRRLEAAMEESQ